MAKYIEDGFFNRENFVNTLKQELLWDIIVIGGGATGLGTAVDAASRGFKVLLLEQSDFSKGTSSRSTKLIHGGVRYLAQGNIGLVYDALKERGILLKNAPHLVTKLPLIIPCYDIFSILKYLSGLKIYDWLAGKLSFGKSEYLSKDEVITALPGIRTKGLKGGIKYFDGQFDDARLALNLAQTAAKEGGVLLNYFQVIGLIKDRNNKVQGVSALDLETNKQYQIRSKTVVNATGVFVDDVLRMDSSTKPLVRPSQGIHIVLEKAFLNGDAALMIPSTSDGRVLFVIPWKDHLLLGTTDTPLNDNDLEPKALDQEIEFILKTARQYLSRSPERRDIKSVFAGLRPLAAPVENTNHTKEISRDHKLVVASSGLITITGGKWTTYRKMAEDTVNKTIEIGHLRRTPSLTKEIKIYGYQNPMSHNDLSIYGVNGVNIDKLKDENPHLNEKLHSDYPYIKAEVVWAVRHEMARTVEDILARRLRILFLDSKSAIEMAPTVASIMAEELGYDENWKLSQLEEFQKLAAFYLPDSYNISETLDF